MMWEILPDGRGRRVLTPNPARQEAATAKRSRKAAKRRRDAANSSEGRAWSAAMVEQRALYNGTNMIPSEDWASLITLPHWDRSVVLEPRWRQRLNARRATGPVQR